MDYLTEINSLRTPRIEKVIEENPLVKTIFFKDKFSAESKPGQFVMVWIPGFDEIPMSVSSTQPTKLVSITIAKVGEATAKLHDMKKGEFIGIRGPFGNNFKLTQGKVMLVSGGTGVAPIAFLADKLRVLKPEITFLLGAKSKNEILFLQKLSKIITRSGGRLIVTTEDGSYGVKGLVTKIVEEHLSKETFDIIYACGKETMLHKIFLLAEKKHIDLQVSLERLMRCAIGLCGSCNIGKYRVCIDGPIFTNNQLREIINEFGSYRKDFSGKKIPI